MRRAHFWLSYLAMSSARQKPTKLHGSCAATVADAVEAATAKLGVARWIGLQHHIVDRRLELAALALEPLTDSSR